MKAKIKVLVVDDHEFFRKGVILTIARFKFAELVGEATDGYESLELTNSLKPDVILMDIKMPRMDGITACEMIKAKHPNIKILALSMFGDEEYLEKMLEAGADGFMTKNIDKEGLERALLNVSEGKQYFSEELLPYFTQKYIKRDTLHPLDTQLTRREVEILLLIAEGLTNQDIAEKLCISLRTVTNHRASLNLKTGSKNTVGLLTYAIRNNLIDYKV